MKKRYFSPFPKNMKSCPICGRQAGLRQHVYDIDFTGYRVVCMKCGMTGPKSHFAWRSVRLWNRMSDKGRVSPAKERKYHIYGREF